MHRFFHNYETKISNLLVDCHRFYRFTRYWYGIDTLIQQHVEKIKECIARSNTLGIYTILNNGKNEINDISKKYNWLSRWLLNLNALILSYDSLIAEVDEKRCHISNDEKPIGMINFKSKIKDNTFSSINAHLENRQKFIATIELRKPNSMPYAMEQYGRHNQICAHAIESHGKPMTYKNLKIEYQANAKLLRQYQIELNQNAHASDNYDGYFTAKNYIIGWLNELSEFSPRVNIDKDTNKPKVEYPYESILFRDKRKAEDYKKSVWESAEEALNRKILLRK